MRKRKGDYILNRNDITDFEERKDQMQLQKFLECSAWIFIILFQLGFFLLTAYAGNHLPPVNNNDSTFSEGRAREHLKTMTSMGSRLVGSRANEVLVVDYLMTTIEKIRHEMNSEVHKLEVDSRRLSGSFDIDFIGGFTSVYEDVNIIAVRLSPSKDARGKNISALLINCHYDSITVSPGGSDDAVSCSIMLEVLRVVSSSDQKLLHSIIFLFNGAEENILQASHGFVTQHEWAKDVKAFINLEAAGAGGKEILFQSGSSWLLEQYAKSVPHPFGSIIGQELFQSGIIPADTDFRIFRDFGNIPGLDIAYIRNGYVYHTKFDQPNMIPTGCIQRGGENLLSLVLSIISSSDFPEVGGLTGAGETKFVFYDILGIFMVFYSMRMATIVNLFAVTIAFARISYLFIKLGRKYLVLVFHCAIGLTISFCLSMLSCISIGLILDLSGHAMSWFTYVDLLIPLYSAPALLVSMVTITFFKKPIFQENMGKLYLEQVCLHDAILLLYSLSLFILSLLGIGSSMAILPLVLFPSILSSFKAYFTPGWKMAALRIASLSPGYVLLSTIVYESVLLCVPVMGRVGPHVIPDLVLALLVAIYTNILFSYLIPLIFITKSVRKLFAFLYILFWFSIFLIFMTNYGFPYGSDELQPTMQKSVINHISRTIRNKEGEIVEADHGIFYLPLDRNHHLPLLQHFADQPGCCDDVVLSCKGRPYCGWPYYFPVLADISALTYIRSPAPLFSSNPMLRLMSRSSTNQFHNFSFSIRGPSHISIYLLPGSGFELTSWSVGSGQPRPTKMPAHVRAKHYFIYYSHALPTRNPFIFNCTLNGDGSATGDSGVIHIALAGHYFFEHSLRNHSDILRKLYSNETGRGNDPAEEEFEYLNSSAIDDFLRRLPLWTAPVYWSATYDAYVF